MSLKTYDVTISFQFPAWDERDGYTYEVRANSKADAVKRGRWMAERDGHAVPGRGRYWFRAVEREDMPAGTWQDGDIDGLRVFVEA